MLGNFMLPLMIGARDLAFPRLNLLSWYLFVAGRRCLRSTPMLVGGVDTGWTFYTPYQHDVLATACRRWRSSASSSPAFLRSLTGLNFIVTIHKLRAPGHDLVPAAAVHVVASMRRASIMVLATPVLAMTLVLIALERLSAIGIFDPALGGDPLLFQHLFWFYSHPAVYIMILPGMGVVSELDRLLLAQDASSAIKFVALCRAWRSRSSASWSGATTCSSAGNRSMPAWCSRS